MRIKLDLRPYIQKIKYIEFTVDAKVDLTLLQFLAKIIIIVTQLGLQ